MPEDTIRTFVACEVPQPVRAAVDRAVAPIRPDASVGWTKPPGWHLTLKFLGDLSTGDVKRVAQAAQEISGDLAPLHVRLGTWGAFPNPKRPRVLWLGVEEGADELTTAARLLDRRLGELGFARETRAFHPHLTLARVRSPREGVRAWQALQGTNERFEPFTADRMVVFQSVLARDGARYTPLAECFFG